MKHYAITHLFLVVIFQGIFVAFFKTSKGYADFCGPPNLGSTQRNLKKPQLDNLIKNSINLREELGMGRGKKRGSIGGLVGRGVRRGAE